jgi:hypothetical protein
MTSAPGATTSFSPIALQPGTSVSRFDCAAAIASACTDAKVLVAFATHATNARRSINCPLALKAFPVRSHRRSPAAELIAAVADHDILTLILAG